MISKRTGYMSDTMRAFRRNRALAKSRYSQLYRVPSALNRVNYGKTNTIRIHYQSVLIGQVGGVINSVWSIATGIATSNDWANIKGTYAQFNCIKVKVVATWNSSNSIQFGMCYDPSASAALTQLNVIGDFNNHRYYPFSVGEAKANLVFRPRPKTMPPFMTDGLSSDSLGYVKVYTGGYATSTGTQYGYVDFYFWLVLGSEQ